MVCAAHDASLCAALTDIDLAALHAIGRRRTIPAGQALAWAGDPAAICGNLVSGVLKIARTDAKGTEYIVALLFPGDFVGALFVDTTAETITALTEVDLCLFTRTALERMLERQPSAARPLLVRAIATLADARRWLLLLGRRTAREKVAAFLLDMARRCPPCSAGIDQFDLPISRTGIGGALGLTVETVCRQVSALRDTGVIALPGGRRIAIIDHARLAELAGV